MRAWVLGCGASVILAACGGAVEQVDDPELEASGKAAGGQSAAIGELPEDSEESEVTSAVQALGSSFQAIQTRHQASYTSGRGKVAAPPIDAATLMQAAGEGAVNWDGERLQMNWSFDESSLSLTYVVDLTFTDTGDGYTISGSYALEYDASAGGSGVTYDLDVDYQDLTTDGTGCATGGALDIAYDYRISAAGVDLPGASGAGDLNGRIVVEFNGCDDVTVKVSQ